MQKEMEKSITKIQKSRNESATADIARVLKVGLGLAKNYKGGDTKLADLSAPLVGKKRTLSESQHGEEDHEDVQIAVFSKTEEKMLEQYEEY